MHKYRIKTDSIQVLLLRSNLIENSKLHRQGLINTILLTLVANFFGHPYRKQTTISRGF